MVIEQIIEEWSRYVALQEEPPPTEPALASVPDENRYGICLENGYRWIAQRRNLRGYGKWFNEVYSWCESGELDYFEVARLEGVLGVFGGISARASVESARATVHLPIDLRFSLELQWTKYRKHLRAVQVKMLEIAGRKGAAQATSSDHPYRDIYCYLLRTKENKRSSEIAATVFPKEDRKAAAGKVRKILQRVREAICAHDKA